jgi:site-specific recombinase XerD
VTLLDTGLRIDEVLGLERSNVDLQGLMLRVRGKGNRERLVPISLECRRRLYLWLKSAAASSFVFCTRVGHRLTARNVYRDIKTVCQSALTRQLRCAPARVFGRPAQDRAVSLQSDGLLIFFGSSSAKGVATCRSCLRKSSGRSLS